MDTFALNESVEPHSIDPAFLFREAKRSDIAEQMKSFYERVDSRIASNRPTCWNHGDCCRFEQFGHRLYVTALEVIYYLAMGDSPASVPEGTCPHAHDGQCHVRDRRPLGCRVFHCDTNAQHWQGPLTESQLGELRDMHVKLNVPYFYAEWLHILRALQAYDAPPDASR
jgi:hypothetical protein